MEYKLIAVDMDGTLLNSQGIITKKTVFSIRRAVEKGVLFTVSTGRPIQGVERYNEILGLDAPFITYNGAMIVKGKSRQVIYQQCLCAEDARSILYWAKRFTPTVMVWSNNKLYVSEFNERTEKYKSLSGVEPILLENEEAVIQNGITKILWYDEAENIARYQPILHDNLGQGINFHTSQPYFLEFVDKNVSKAQALERLGQYYNISSEEMIAIGDGLNDLPMIEYAGLGVAMENAHALVRKRADFVTKSCDEDGVAYAIDKYINEAGD